MELEELKDKIPENIYNLLKKHNLNNLRPSQTKAINQGLFDLKNLLVCTPTASGKTLIGEMAALNHILNFNGKAIYIVPLKALATEKYKDLKKKYPELKIAISIGDLDSADSKLHRFDFIITTSEKFDSLIRHHTPWLQEVKCVIVDEIHLLNDPERGPTLEILITILQKILKAQIIGLSATIGNPHELAGWLKANYVEDTWRPVRLDQGIIKENELQFF